MLHSVHIRSVTVNRLVAMLSRTLNFHHQLLLLMKVVVLGGLVMNGRNVSKIILTHADSEPWKRVVIEHFNLSGTFRKISQYGLPLLLSTYMFDLFRKNALDVIVIASLCYFVFGLILRIAFCVR